jgi:hypothetical protein
MLNELYYLAVALEKVGITPRAWHKDLKPLPNATPKKPCYKILLVSDGSVSGIEPMHGERTSLLRKWEPNLGNSFPGFNIQPLYRITNEDRKKRLKKWREGKEAVDVAELKNWCHETQSKNWDTKTSKKLTKCLGETPNQLRERCGDIPEKFDSVKKLFEGVSAWKDDTVTRFAQGLESRIWTSLEGGEDIPFLLPILVHEGSPSKEPEDDRGSISVFMDVQDWKDYPVAHKETIWWINTCLLRSNGSDQDKVENHNQAVDAFGLESIGCEDKLPDVKLPIIAGVKLRAMTSESPCQYRYGTIDAKSFRIGADSRKRVKGALEWLSSDEHEGETWGRVDGRELIFAYPAILPKVPLKLAACLGARKMDDSEARFENYAKDVVDCLKGLAPSLKEIDLRVFSLRKMDKARTKVVFHRNYSAQRLEDAAREWQQGCDNIPAIQIKTWGKEKGEIILSGPKTPFPLQIAECLSRVWKQDGTTQCEIKGTPKSVGIELLLDGDVIQSMVLHWLAVALQNGEGLFLSMGDIMHRKDVFKLDGLNKHKQLMPAILGLLLWKIGIRKETYMNNPPYLVGRMLKLSDELHALYCKEVRKNSLPPQLLGNALMVAALDSPTQAIAQLALRIAPYLGWARTNSTKSAGLSRYFLKEFGLVEAKLRDTTLPGRLDDPARAQLLLGYISSNTQTEETINN